MIGWMFQKELMLMRITHKKNVIFFIVGNLKQKVLSMNHTFSMVVEL